MGKNLKKGKLLMNKIKNKDNLLIIGGLSFMIIILIVLMVFSSQTGVDDVVENEITSEENTYLLTSMENVDAGYPENTYIINFETDNKESLFIFSISKGEEIEEYSLTDKDIEFVFDLSEKDNPYVIISENNLVYELHCNENNIQEKASYGLPE